MTIGDHVALWNGPLRHKMHTPAPPRLPCWSSAQVTLVYNGPLTQDKPLSVGAAQKTSCVPRGISTSPPLQPIHPREGKMAQSTHRAFLHRPQRRPNTRAPGTDTRQQANLGKRKPCSVSQSVSCSQRRSKAMPNHQEQRGEIVLIHWPQEHLCYKLCKVVGHHLHHQDRQY